MCVHCAAIFCWPRSPPNPPAKLAKLKNSNGPSKVQRTTCTAFAGHRGGIEQTQKNTREWPLRFLQLEHVILKETFPNHMFMLVLGAKGGGFSCFFITCSKKMSIHRMIPKDVCQRLDFNNTRNFCTRILTVG